MAGIVKISGQPVMIYHNTLRIDDVVESRSTATFHVVDESGTKEYVKGQPVEIYDDDELLFAGVIESSDFDRYSPTSKRIHYVRAIDWVYLADKRVIAKAYESEYIGDIVRDIVSNILADEGVTIDYIAHSTFLQPAHPVDYPAESTVHDGPMISQVAFNYVRVSDALDSLAERAGYWWSIDPHKKLFFTHRTAYQAPFDITLGICERGTVKVKNGNSLYRNVQYIRGARDITDPQTETRKGDGEAQSFFTGFKVAKVPTVEVSYNGSPFVVESVGIRGLESGKQWYWSKGENVITQDSSGTPLSANDVIKITYQGEFDIIVTSSLPDQISSQAAIDGTSGIVEDVADETSITGRDAAFEAANSKLAKYGRPSKTLSFRTWRKGLRPGMLVTANLPEYGLHGEQLLIESIRISYESNVFWYDVKAVSGPQNKSWASFFGQIAARGLVIRENLQEEQIITTIENFSKTWPIEEQPNLFRVLYAADDLFPSNDLYPSFDPGERIRYLAWYNGSTELGRKPITKQTTVDGEIESITYLSPVDAVGTITHLGWIGGIDATEAVSSGVVTDKQDFAKTKTQLEAIQVTKTDTRDFTPDPPGTKLLDVRYWRWLDSQIELLLATSQ